MGQAGASMQITPILTTQVPCTFATTITTTTTSPQVTTCIKFPVKGLDVSQFCTSSFESPDSGAVYDLVGVSNHMGGLSGGHYTADCLNLDTFKVEHS
jgi:ubiquitin C-terminal hydrolase